MPRRLVRLAPDRRALRQELADVRRELKIPTEFAAAPLAEAREAARSQPRPGLDFTDEPFVNIDPASSMDLDQVIVEVAPRRGVDQPGFGEVVIRSPAVRGRVTGTDLPLGEGVTVRLVEATIPA